jgi:NTE family protein
MERLTELAGKIGRTFEEGDVVFQQGEMGDTMYILHEGTLAVIREKDGAGTVVGRLNRGDFVGEMALVSGKPRVAAAMAAAPTVLMPVSKEAFLEKVRTDPAVALHTIQILIVRLRRSLQMLA